jgi:hypothetical protein
MFVSVHVTNITHEMFTGGKMLGGSIHTIRKNTEALLIASKDIGLEVNAEKTKSAKSLITDTRINGHLP